MSDMNRALELGISKQQLLSLQKRINDLEQSNDAVADTRIRHAVNERLVEIRLLLRDGHLKNKNVAVGVLTHTMR